MVHFLKIILFIIHVRLIIKISQSRTNIINLSKAILSCESYFWVGYHGGTKKYGSCEPNKIFGLKKLTQLSVAIMVVQDVLSMAACRIFQSYLSRTCSSSLHAYSKPLLHAFVLDTSLSFHIVSIRSVHQNHV